MEAGNLTIRPASESSQDEFYELHSDSNEAAWCFCTAWWTSTWEGFGRRTSEQNRALRDELFKTGQSDGYLLQVDGETLAWCQCGPRDRLEKLLSTYELQPDPSVWAFTCFLVAKPWRGRGLANRLLRGALADLARKGVTRVQGYPRAGVGMEDEDVWQGTEQMFQHAGFQLFRQHDTWPVYELALDDWDPE